PFRLTDSVRSSSDTAFGCGYAMYEDDGSIAWDEFFDNEELGAPSFSFRRLIMNSTDTAMNTHRVFCLTEATGAELWSKDLASPGASVPVADDDAQAYVITEAGMLHKLNEQGQDVWSEQHEAPSTGLVLYDDTLFLGAGDSIEAVDISDGSLLYSQSVPDGIEATPV